MNIIALFELTNFDKSKIGDLSTEDYAEIKKQLIAQKETYPEIEDLDITKLLKVMKTQGDSFKAILNIRVLYNFFANTDYPRAYFLNESDPEKDKVKLFITQFLGEELNSFFKENLEENKYNEISILAEAKNYFPDNLNFILKQHSLDKLDDAITVLKPPYGNFSKILYIKNPNFFAFLSQIKDQEIEEKIRDLIQTVYRIYKNDYSSEMANKTFSAMNSYKPFDTDLSQKIRSNKDIGESNFEAHIPKKRNLTWVYVLVGFLALIRIGFFLSTIHFDDYTNGNNNDVTYDDETEYKPEPRKIDKYYTNMKFAIDSFQTFLTNFKESEIKQLTQESSLKTGVNPFETFYKNPPTADSNHFITVTNSTKYDMVLLENTVLYDSIKMPRSAHFIKAGEDLEINFNSNYTETIFNIYLGKKWATFQTNKNQFIRNHSIVEYRFSELIPDSRDILKTDYNFLNDAVISYSNGGLNIDSQGAMINPLQKHK